MTNRTIRIWMFAVVLVTNATAWCDVWSDFVASAARDHGEAGRNAAAFLAANRPARDAGIDAALLKENLDAALRARTEFPWARALSDEMFFNDVLPYAVLDETRESWRPGFYERCKGIVKNCSTATEAAQALNREVFKAINVHYNTGRKKPNQSPGESVAQGRATCTGLAIILVDACRAVGVPARVAGVANWSDDRGNHTWVEVWDGAWHFTGADEYDDKGLDRAWFKGDARNATAGDPEHAVWASSWKGTGLHFPLVWNPGDTSVPGVDVTARYAGGGASTAAAASSESGGDSTVRLRVWDRKGGERLALPVTYSDAAGHTESPVTTRAGTADLNDMPTLNVRAGDPGVLKVTRDGHTRTAALDADGSETRTIDLYWDELGLSQQEATEMMAQRFLRDLVAIRVDRVHEGETEEIKEIKWEDFTLKVLEKTFGDEPEGGHSLWISMHGGGGAPTEVNDQQWHNQIKLYTLDEGIYVAPRAPTDTWNLWHQGHIDPLFGKLIDTYVATRHVNPDRVYLMGYSAGGDGVFQLAPRMADRFAAAAMMAGHPNETKPLGLRDLPFALLMGGDDGAYHRNEVAKKWSDELDALQAADPRGYVHKVIIYPGLGHWMEHKDAEILPWMAEKTRVAWPRRVVWLQDDVTHKRFYWLAVDEPKERALIDASVDGQTISITSDDVSAVRLRLRDELIDLDRAITVEANGEQVFEGLVPRTQKAIEQSFDERLDPSTACTATLGVRW